MSKRAVFIVALVVVALSATSVLYRVVAPQRASFDSPQWMLARSDDDYTRRFTMLEDLQQLIRSGAVVDQRSAMSLLGPPERGSGSDTWGYRLGVEDAWSTRGYERWLELIFDASERLVAHRVVTDAGPMPVPQVPTGHSG
jgi:hypothetical protein